MSGIDRNNVPRILPAALEQRLATSHRGVNLSLGQPSPSALDRGLALVALWAERARTRRQMRRDMQGFNEAVFRDFGTTREKALAEVAKPFWRG